MRFLPRKADVDTRYGGRFVNAIEGVRSQAEGGTRRDWFYYVNGIEADKGAAEREVHRAAIASGGTTATGARRCACPAVVGSYPGALPARRGGQAVSRADRLCAGRDRPVRGRARPARARRCRDQPSRRSGRPSGKDMLRVVVGEWEDVRGRRGRAQARGGTGRERRVRAPWRRGRGVRDRAARRAGPTWRGRSARAPGSWLRRASRSSSRRGWCPAPTTRASSRAVRLLDRARAARPLRGRGRRRGGARSRSR